MWVAWLRGCTPTLEQPRGSALILHPALQALVQYLAAMQQSLMFGHWAETSVCAWQRCCVFCWKVFASNFCKESVR